MLRTNAIFINMALSFVRMAAPFSSGLASKAGYSDNLEEA
jgi:hypothetical protein